MSKKSKIICISVILSLFIIVMVVITIIQINANKVVDESVSSNEHNYAINETKDDTDIDNDDENEEETTNIVTRVDDREVSHLERLTTEQNAAKVDMYTKLDACIKNEEEAEGKIALYEEISESSNEYQTYVVVTFDDDSTTTYVVTFDATRSHQYLRCVTLEEWEMIQSGENAG